MPQTRKPIDKIPDHAYTGNDLINKVNHMIDKINELEVVLEIVSALVLVNNRDVLRPEEVVKLAKVMETLMVEGKL